MSLLKHRKAQSHTATGRQRALTDGASTNYPAWPKDLVDLPSDRLIRKRSLAWYDRLLRHRTPSGWQPGDAGRVAMLARYLVGLERESSLLMEQAGGDAGVADKYRGMIALLSRQLGLQMPIRDPRLSANDAMARAEGEQHAADLEGDDLIARPPAN